MKSNNFPKPNLAMYKLVEEYKIDQVPDMSRDNLMVQGNQ